MPIVPTDENRVRIEGLPNARSNVNYSPEAFGAGIGRGLQAVAGVVGQYAEQERQKQDTAVIMGAERQLQEWENRALFTPESGAYAQKGSASFGLIDKVMPEYDKTYSDIESSLNSRQQELFRQRTATKRADIERGLMRHTGQEAEVYQQSETAALVQTRLNTAVLYTSDPARFDAELREAQGVFLAGNPNIPPATQALGLQKIASEGRSMAVNKLMQDDPPAAQRYFNEYRDEFTAADAAQIEQKLEPAMDQAAGEAFAKSVKSGLPTAGAGGNYTPNDDRAAEISKAAAELGVDPIDLATVIGYETIGTFDPSKKGPVTHRGQHIGLIQFGDEEQRVYGAHSWQTFAEQMPAVVRYLKARGIKPGMGMLDIYSAINAGSPGRYNASDGNTGDKTVRDKVGGTTMAAYRKKAEAMFTRAGDSGEMASPESAAAAAIPQPKSWTDVIEAASRLPDSGTRQAAIAYAQTQEAVEKRREAETEKAMAESMNTKVEQAPPGSQFAKVVTRSELAYAQSKGWVRNYEARLVERAAGTEKVTPTDQLLAYRSVVAQAFAGDATAQKELLSYKPYDPKLTMSVSDRDWLAKSQETLRSGSQAEKVKAATEGEIEMVIGRVTGQNLGIPDWKKAFGKNTPTGQKATKFYNDLRSWRSQFVREKNREPSYDEVQQRADEMTLTFTREEPGMLYGTNTVTSNVFDIPAEDRDRIIENLRALGYKITGENVFKVYSSELKKSGVK